DREVGLDALARELLLDPAIEAIAEAAGERDLDAGKTLLEVPDPALVRTGRPGAVENERLLELRLGVELVHALGARAPRPAGKRRDEQRKRKRRLRQGARMSFPRFDKLAYHTRLKIWRRPKSRTETGGAPMPHRDIDRRGFLGASAAT